VTDEPTRGNYPRSFSFDPSGKFVLVASQEEDRVQVFSFDDATGSMRDLHQDIPVKSPVSLLIR
jgi:6-phosphogluconolactonase